MSIKLKALGLGLLAMVAMSAFAAMNAGATVSGHFVTGSEHTFITGIVQKGTTHDLHFVSEGGSEIGCDSSQYTGTHKSVSKTTTELTITPAWDQCYTTPDGTKFGVHENGCDLVFKSRAALGEATVNVNCASGKKIVITHPSCEISVPTQTVGGQLNNGVTYTNQNDGTSWVTMDVKVNVAAEYHNGFCVFLGTNHTAVMEGAVTVTGFSNAAHSVRTSISAT